MKARTNDASQIRPQFSHSIFQRVPFPDCSWPSHQSVCQYSSDFYFIAWHGGVNGCECTTAVVSVSLAPFLLERASPCLSRPANHAASLQKSHLQVTFVQITHDDTTRLYGIKASSQSPLYLGLTDMAIVLELGRRFCIQPICRRFGINILQLTHHVLLPRITDHPGS